MADSRSSHDSPKERLVLPKEQDLVEGDEPVFLKFIKHINNGTLTEEVLSGYLKIDPALLSRRDNRGRFALIHAIESCSNPAIDANATIRLLLDHGADIHQTYYLRTPIAFLERNDKYEEEAGNKQIAIQADLIKRLSAASHDQPSEGAQGFLISLGKQFGYQMNEGGVCHGYAHMAVQAFLLQKKFGGNALHEFDARMVWARGISQEKHLENYQCAVDKLKKINLSARQQYPAEKEKRDEYVQKHIYKSLTRNELLVLSLHDLFEGIELYQSARRYKQLFEKSERPKHQSPEPVAKMLVSVDLENQGGFVTLAHFSGVYDQEEMVRYFLSLQKNAESAQLPVALTLSSLKHTITVTYDPVAQCFSLINANRSGAGSLKNPTVFEEFDDPSRLVTAVREAFVTEVGRLRGFDSLAIATAMFVATCNIDSAKMVLRNWREAMSEMHTVTPYKAHLSDLVDGTWEYLAINAGDEESIRKLHQSALFFNRHRDMLIVFLAVGIVLGVTLGASMSIIGLSDPLMSLLAGLAVPIVTTGGCAIYQAIRDSLIHRQAVLVEGIRSAAIAELAQEDSPELSVQLSTTANLSKCLEQSDASIVEPTENKAVESVLVDEVSIDIESNEVGSSQQSIDKTAEQHSEKLRLPGK